MLQIRPIDDGDVEPLRTIFNAIIATGEAFTYDEPFTSESMRRYLGSYTAGGCVATMSGRVVGGYVLRPNQPGRGSHVCNATYVVDAKTRGAGVGKRLGEDSLVRAKDLGFLAMQFNAVVSTNEAAVRLWTSLRFETVGRLPRAFRRGSGEHVDLLVMFRRLV